MSLELWNTTTAVATFVVITLTAIAALIQLAHLRRSNQLQAVIDLGNAFGALAKHISFVFAMLPEKMKDPDFRRDVGRVINADEHPELLVCAFCDQLGMLVRWHLMEEQFIMGYAGGADRIVRCWENLEEVIAIRRRLSPGAYVNFEYLTSRARKWITKFPQGNYPTGEPRMQLTDRWATDETNPTKRGAQKVPERP